MTTVQAGLTYYKQVNEQIRAAQDSEITVENVIGQRYIGCGSTDRKITVHGTAGNGLGQYLNGSTIEVFGNAQEAVGDTMNAGEIVVHGNVGDACGYAMRGGKIYIKGDCGYRAGIHMKAYQQHFPVMVVGGKAGSFLGEYLAGGLILVLGIGQNGAYPVNNFCGTGMHGGRIFLRCSTPPRDLPAQVSWRDAEKEDLESIRGYAEEFAEAFGYDADELLSHHYIVLTPNSANPYKQLYTPN